MSAIPVTCDDCGEIYMTGVVGVTPWPPHECEPPKEIHRCGMHCWQVGGDIGCIFLPEKS